MAHEIAGPPEDRARLGLVRGHAGGVVPAAPGHYGGPPPEEIEGEGIDLRAYWAILVRRKWTVILFTLLAVAAATLWTLQQSPIYRSTITLKIDYRAPKVVTYQGVTPEEQGGWYSQDYYQTQYELLKSKTLAQRVADELGLQAEEGSSDGRASPQGLVGRLVAMVQGWVGVEPSSEGTRSSQASTPKPTAELVLGGLSVEPVKGSRLVRVSYDSTDPKLAARVLNTLADAFINESLERRFGATAYAKKFLQERIEQVRANLEDSERRLAQYTAEHGIVDMDEAEGMPLDELKALKAALVQAQTDRLKLEGQYRQLKQGHGKALARVLDDPLIQELKGSLAELQAEYQEKLNIYKPAYPKMVQLQTRIEQVQQAIDEEIGNIREAVRQSYLAKLQEERALKARVDKLAAAILKQRAATTDFNALKREVDTNRELYDGLLQRLKEVSVVAGIGTNNVSVVDPAEVPSAPYKPNLRKNVMIALMLGLMGGFGLALLFEHMDDTVKSATDLEKLLQRPVLGLVPLVEKSDQELPDGVSSVPMLAHLAPKSAIAEAFRSLRTALQFSTAEGAPKLLHYTSSAPGEGKTTSAVATAITYAQTGATVLLIDADLRNPSVHKELRLSNARGLTNCLTGHAKPVEVTQETEVQGLFCITAGPSSPNPVELLSSGNMVDLLQLASQRFDYVVVDGPPVLGLADALVLGAMAHATILVVQAGETRKGAVEAAMRRLHHVQVNLIGGLLAKYARGGGGYGYDYDYYGYHYYGYGTELPGGGAAKGRLATGGQASA